MQERAHEMLRDHTTLHVGGPAGRFLLVDDADELVRAVREADASSDPVLVLGGGSNLLVGDDGFPGVVVHPHASRIERLATPGPDARHEVLVRCGAGTPWDEFVAFAVEQGLSGVEALSGIPGLIGSACMQNIGAYGQEMGSSLVYARLYDRATREVKTVRADSLQLGYRNSLLRDSLEEPSLACERWFPSPRWVVLDATFGLRDDPRTVVEHPQLAHALGVSVGDEGLAADVRREVLAVRGSKAMLADDGTTVGAVEHDRWSSGSFFTNPLLAYPDAERLPPEAPRYPALGGVKTSAAWLIEHAGFSRGFGVHGTASRATLSTRHTLAITNRGDATAADLIELARTVRDGVHATFSITLTPETVLVGTRLDDVAGA